MINQLDKFLKVDRRLYTKLLNDAKHFDQLIGRIDSLIGQQLAQVKFNLFTN